MWLRTQACAANRYNFPTCTFCVVGVAVLSRRDGSAARSVAHIKPFAPTLVLSGALIRLLASPRPQASTTCTGHGSCSAADGSCQCAPFFALADCSACVANHFGPSCAACPGENSGAHAPGTPRRLFGLEPRCGVRSI